MTKITLKELYDFAKARPHEKFNVGSPTNCLACQLIKERGFSSPRYMPVSGTDWGFCANSKDGERHYFSVPKSFDDYCCIFSRMTGSGQGIKTGEEITVDFVSLSLIESQP